MLSLRKSKELIHHTEEEVYSILFQLSIFACMLVTTTLLTLSTHDTYMYQFDSNINRIFLNRESGTIFHMGFFEQLITIQDWYNYLDEVFLKYWHNQNVATDSKENILKTPVFLKENFHIGVARVRQIRVKPNSCVIHDLFNRYFNTCFVRYFEENEDTEQYYKGYKYFHHNKFPVGKIQGMLGKYTGPGYVVFFSDKEKDNKDLVQSLEAIKWVDRATRLLVIEFVLYNSNMNMFINVKLITEVLATGSVVSSYEVLFLPIYSIWSTKQVSVLLTSSLFYMLVVFYTSEEFWFFRIYGFYNYLRNKWNILDCGILITAYIALVLSLMHPFRVNKRLFTILKNRNGDIFIDDLCYWHDVFRFFLTICAILVWMKIFRFISFNLTMLRFSMAISRSFKDILGFSVMFFIVFIAYSLLGLLLFSDINPGFADFSKALVTMMRMIMGDYQYQNIEKANSVLGPIFFISYILFIFFILLNMFLAVISDTYVSVKEGLQPQQSQIQTKLIKVWQKTVKALTRCCGRKKSRANKLPAGVSFDADGRRSVKEDDVKNDFYDPANSTPAFLDGSVTFEHTPHANESEEEFAKLTQKVDSLEYELEVLIAKMDRILQKLDAKVDEQKAAKSLGKMK